MQPQRRAHRGALIVAALVLLSLKHLLPYGQLALYPLTLLGTWVHEMGHGLTALLVGGSFARLEIFADASGVAQTAALPGLRTAALTAGGLLAPPVVGALLLSLAARFSRLLLLALSGALLLSLLLWVRTAVGWLAIAPLCAAIALVARHGGAEVRVFTAQLLGLVLAGDTLARIDYFFMPSARIGGRQLPSDVAGVASNLGGPYQLWGALLAGTALLLLALGLWAALRPRGPSPATHA